MCFTNTFMITDNQASHVLMCMLMQVSGESAFFMYDTMGFPVDLTQLMASEKGLTVDVQVSFYT